MTSFVYYKFRSQKNGSRIEFDGTGISVFDLKREILLANNFVKANDFDLALFDQKEQEYKDDTTIIPRSSSVTVSRLPAACSGRGRAMHYLAGAEVPLSRPPTAGLSMPFRGPSGPMLRRFETHKRSKPTSAPSTNSSTPISLAGDEAASIAAMFAATEHQWGEAQENMSHASQVPLNSTRGGPTRKAVVPPSQGPKQDHTARPTPRGYVCYRCGHKGHWIQECPTNNDREFDNRPRIKRTTGIPRSFLKPVDQPAQGSLTAGVMLTPEGGYVVAQPDAASWQKNTMRKTTLTEAEIRAKPPPDASLACSLCSGLFREAVKTPCCGAVYCEECIQTHLLEDCPECPACHSEVLSLDKLVPEKAVRTSVQAHIDNALAESRAESSNGERQLASGSGTPTKTSQIPNGGPIYGNEPTPEQQQLFPEPAEIQAQLDQVHMMLKNPTLSQQARMQLQMKLPELMSLLERARMVAALAEAALASARASHVTSISSMNMGGYGNGMMLPRAWNPNEYRPQWTNPFPNQQPAGPDSAYERLPVKNHRRGMKRDCPSDSLEIGGAGPVNKVARYWE